jgi:hypothetical protein
LFGGNTTFSWTPGMGVSQYKFYMGTTGAGSSDLYAGGPTTATSVLVPLGTLPFNGATIYGALFSEIDGTWQPVQYTYTEAQPAVITSPIPGSQLSGSSVTFQWSGFGTAMYLINVGTKWPGADDIYGSGVTTATSATVSGLPTDGITVYVMVRSLIDGVWYANFYTYTASGSPTPPALIKPSLGSHLASSTATFQWLPGSGPTAYLLNVGTKWPGADDIYGSGVTTATSAAVSGLPTNGVNVYVLLRYRFNGVWTDLNYTYTAAGATAPPVMTNPAPRSQLSGSSVTFQWSPGSGPSAYLLNVGTKWPGADDIYGSGVTTATSATVTGLPTNSGPVYVLLRYEINSVWTDIFYTYTAASSPDPAIISPSPGSRLPGSTVNFFWTAGVDPIDNIQTIFFDVTRSDHYTLIYSGQYGPYDAGATVSGIPTDGETIYVDLAWVSAYTGSVQGVSYAYIAAQ